jgi:DNA-binding winged helix-turn-helix (wHTH) protein
MVIRFGVFELDAQSGELRRHGLKVRLPDQSFQILRLLLDRPGEVVTREELRQRLWSSDTSVDFDAGLNSAMRKLREALDDSAENPRFVETLPRRGYRFIGSPKQVAVDQPPDPVSDSPAESGARIGRRWIAALLLVPSRTVPLTGSSATLGGAHDLSRLLGFAAISAGWCDKAS